MIFTLKMKSSSLIKLLIAILIGLSSFYAFNQEKNIMLANEYFSVNDFAKAVAIYKKYVVKEEYRNEVYENYRASELQLSDYSSLFKYLKKINKKHPEELITLIDLIDVEKLGEFYKDYNKDYKQLYNLVKDDAYTFYKVAEQLTKRKMYNDYISLILDVRRDKKDTELYGKELIAIYQITGNTNGMIDEVLIYLRNNPLELESVENIFQSNFDDNDYLLLEKKLFDIIGKDGHFTYRELMVWYYIQEENFYEAFVQQRAIDISKRERGYGLLKIAEIASSNESYQQSIEILDYICDKYAEQEIYVNAKTRLIEIKEIQIENDYPIDTVQINMLMDDYNELLLYAQNQNEKARILQNQASLYAFYLHDNEFAINLLTKVTKTGGISKNQQASAWLLLGDIYLLDDQIGEASLTYFNIENRWKNSSYAEQAKYKNAQLYFYTGEFALSQSMLDILKRATSREISNDAIDLSIFIKANSGLDTSFDALQLYADADLLSYQRKYLLALQTYDKLLTDFSGHSLTDEVYWEKAKIFRKIKEYDNQIDQLELLVKNYSTDIWADDAVYLLAEIFEEKNDKKSAMQYYKAILLDYKGSIYTENARLAYRRLRGDGI